MQKFLKITGGAVPYLIPVKKISHVGIEGNDAVIWSNQVLLTGASNTGEIAVWKVSTGSAGDAESAAEYIMDLIQEVLQKDWRRPSLEKNATEFPVTVSGVARDQLVWAG